MSNCSYYFVLIFNSLNKKRLFILVTSTYSTVFPVTKVIFKKIFPFKVIFAYCEPVQAFV